MALRIWSHVASYARKHKDQPRKDKDASPYTNHPIGLANLLVNHGYADIETIFCTIMHDTI